MDGDHSAKSMEAGANSAMKGGTDMVDGIHESVNQTVSLQSRLQRRDLALTLAYSRLQERR